GGGARRRHNRTRARERCPTPVPPPESRMRASLLTLALASLLALPAAAQEVPPVPEEAPPAAQDGAEPVDEATPDEQANPADPADPADPIGPAEAAEALRQESTASPASTVPLEEISRFVLVFNAVRAGHVDEVDDHELMQAAIRGLLLDLDPHSAYLQRSDAEAFEEGTTGAYEGIGVEVMQLPDGRIRVVAPMDGSPAQRAGIRSGDVIVAVDGKPLTPESHDGRGPLRGPPGTEVGVTVVREGEAEPLELRVARAVIRKPSVRGEIREPGFGYVRIASFQADTATDF